MKYPHRTDSRLHRFLPLALAALLVMPLPALAASTTLATSPLATSTTSTVAPNLMFMLDDSGSMDWDFMPDTAKNFSGNYGFESSHCNGVYYNPNITYTPPVDSTGASYANASFTNAWNTGYQTNQGTVDLNSQFPGGSGSGSSGAANYQGPAFYYVYTGAQNTSAQMDYLHTSSTFYKECNSNEGSTPGSAVFTKYRLASVASTTIVVTPPPSAGGATITINSAYKGRVSSINSGASQILSGQTSKESTTGNVAQDIADGINYCTNSTHNTNCTTTGYSATVSGSVVTVYGPAVPGTTMTLSTSGTLTYTVAPFPSPTSTSVSTIRVNGVNILYGGATALETNANNLATDIKNNITATNFSATVSGNVVTVTYTGGNPAADSSNYTPVIVTTTSGGSGSIGMLVTADPFPESTPAKLQNFANWYSYYSNRMLMMKTGVGQAFSAIGSDYRVGFMTMNNNRNPDIVDIAPFTATQKSAWYSKLYDANPGNSTPLREVLAKVGRLYAHKYGTITTYTSTITVGGSGTTAVYGITVGTDQLMTGSSALSSYQSTVAKNIAGVFVDPSSYNAVASGNTITITGPSTASGSVPVISDNGGGMTFTATAFTPSTSTNKLNGITPNDPVQYSCQQNFIILSTDGYWNGNAGYQIDGSTAVGNQDGAVSRPQYDGASGTSKITTNYTQNSYSQATSGASGCASGQYKLATQPQAFACSTTTTNGVQGAESCTAASNVGSPSYSGLCVTSVTLPSPNPSNRVAGTSTSTTSVTGGTSDTLADVAMYYYQTDLRTSALNNCTGALGGGVDVCQNNVFKTDTDNNTAQHMATFALGLGASGKMAFSPSYLTDSSGDYNSVLKGLKADSTASPPICSWQSNGTTCNWPTPSSGSVANIDDLWHAAIDGRGNYFSATDPVSLAVGMHSSLAAIASRKGSSAAAATSTLNPVAGNNYAYVASYTTVKWQGNLEARTINVNTGVISQTASWCAESIVSGTCAAPNIIVADNSGGSTIYNCVTSGSTTSTCTAPGVFDTATSECRTPMATNCTGTMPSRIAANSDTRTIYTANSGGTALIGFGSGTDSTVNAAYATANSTNFNAAHISGLTQWTSLTATQQTAAAGANLVSYLRGQTGFENRAVNLSAIDNRLFRYREATLGDALESQPVYISKPVFSYADKGYSDYATAQSARPGTVYMGTNDGMLHAFSAITQSGVPGGTERWAYVPSMVIPNMWRLADEGYATLHTNYVNGSAVISDICTANCLSTDAGTAVWRSILVGGLNQGGRGYYALDITDPSTPTLLWEFTTTTGQGSTKDDDIGYSYGNPVITAKADGTWVVLLTSGYNNISPGSGKGYLYVLNAGTGAIISKIGTGAGSTTTPSGFAQTAAWNDAPSSNRATYVYGGDLLGNLWRFDINSAATATIGTGDVLKFAALADPSGTAQPITTAPILGKILGKRVIFVGTGRYLGSPDLSDTQVQSLYAIKDDNATTTLTNPGDSPRDSVQLVQQTLTTGNGVRTASNHPVDFTTGRGWYIDFPDSGERVNIEGRLVQGTLLIATIVPSNTVCAPGGYGWLNFFDYQSGSSIDTASGIVSASYDNTIVGLNVLYINGAPVIETVTSNDPTPSVNNNVLIKGTASGFTGQRVLWRELNP